MRLSILFVFMLMFLGCNEEVSRIKASGNTIKVGVLVSLEDYKNNNRLDMLKGLAKLDAYLDNGDKIELVIKSTEGGAQAAFSKLISEEKPKVIISYLDSTAMLSLKNHIRSAKIPVIAVIATHSKLNDIKYISRVCLNNRLEGEVAASFLRDELFIPTLTLISDETNAFSTDLSGFFKERYENIGGSISHEYDVKVMLENPKAFVAKLKTQKVNTLYMTVDAVKSQPLLKELHHQDLSLEILAHDGFLSSFKDSFPQELALIEGILVVDNYADDTKVVAKAAKLISTFNKDEFTLDSVDALSYDAWTLLKGGLASCDKVEGECINTYLRNIDSFEGIIENISMHKGEASRVVYVNKIHDGQMKILVKVY